MAITIDTSIPCGNACEIEVTETGGTTEVRFAPDPHGGPECLWFCFRIRADGPQRGGTVKLVLKHFYNALAAPEGKDLRPVVKADGGDWSRLPAGTMEPLADGRFHVTWTLPAPKRTADVALCYPYARTELDALVDETDGYWRADVIGVSQAARPLLRLSNSVGEAGSDRPGLYLVARQHSGETPGSWVLDGFLRHLAARGDDAPLVWAVPLTNIDGIEQGDYGKDNFPYDLNRSWGQPPMRHEVLVFQRDVARWTGRCRPVLGMDFHAPGGTETTGVYLFLPKCEDFPEPHASAAALAEALAEALTEQYAAADFARVATYASRWESPTFTEFCCRQAIPALSLETPYALAGDTLLTRQEYRRIGERIAARVCERFPRGAPEHAPPQ